MKSRTLAAEIDGGGTLSSDGDVPFQPPPTRNDSDTDGRSPWNRGNFH